MRSKAAVIILFLFCSQLYAQEFAYVTDSLKLRLYSSSNDSSEVLLSIESGDSVEVIEKQGRFSRVITNDGTEGWVKSAFLVEDPPEKLLYYSVSEQNKQLQTQIAELQNVTPTDATTNNEAELKKIAELQSALAKEQEINQRLQEQIAEAGSVQTRTGEKAVAFSQSEIAEINRGYKDKRWLLPSIAAALLFLGFLIGLKLSAWRMRNRLHGFALK